MYTEKPFEVIDGVLCFYVEYKASEYSDKTAQAKHIADIVEAYAAVQTKPEYMPFSAIMTITDSKTLLERQLIRYTARNTFDYFIHKDLGKFLRRELDFYIKNDVIFLDDIDEQNEAKTKEYLTKAKVIRKIARKIITFLAQIEDFQKKLYLKKKFVVETNYCITLDRVPESMYPEIAANVAQREEWVPQWKRTNSLLSIFSRRRRPCGIGEINSDSSMMPKRRPLLGHSEIFCHYRRASIPRFRTIALMIRSIQSPVVAGMRTALTQR